MKEIIQLALIAVAVWGLFKVINGYKDWDMWQDEDDDYRDKYVK